jgi:membrane protein
MQQRFQQARVFLISLTTRILRSDITGAASAMAFSFFLSLFPLLLALGFVLGMVVRRTGIDSLLVPVLPLLPIEVRPLLVRELTAISDSGALPAPFLALGFLWAASSGVHGLFSGIESILEIPPRPFWRKRLMAIAFVLASLLVFPVVGYALVYVNGFVSEGTFKLVLALTFMTIGTSILALTYHLVARKDVHHKNAVWPGAVAAIGAWILVSWGFAHYVKQLGNYSAYYGSLAVVAILLLWCWLSALVLLGGAVINHHRVHDEVRKAPT